MPFELPHVRLAAVDTQDDTYRLTPPRDGAALEASIACMGLLCAPILVGSEKRWTVISGFRRVAACRRLGWERIPARLPADTTDPWRCARWAVAEKAAERPLEGLAAGRALRLLRRFAPGEEVLGQALRHFGLPHQPEARERLESLCDLPDAIQAAVSDGVLAVSTALSLGRMPPETAQGVAALLSALRFGVNKQREVLTLLEEIARREGMPLDAVLEAPELKALAADVESDPAQRGHRLRTYLYQRRYPALSRAQRRFETLSRGLCPDPGVQLAAPQGFESRAFRLTLAFSSRSDLARHRQTLERLLSDPDLDEMFQLA